MVTRCLDKAYICMRVDKGHNKLVIERCLVCGLCKDSREREPSLQRFSVNGS